MREVLPAKGGAAGVGAAALSGASAENVAAQAQVTRWDRTVDVVVVGAGAAGMPAAVRARDLGASVILIEENTDVGGHAMARWLGRIKRLQNAHGLR